MKKVISAQSCWYLAWAVSLVAIQAADAQYATENNNGRVNDVNNRLGSGGINEGRPQGDSPTANDIVYGNVTRGREFHAHASGDPRAFRENLATPSDNMTRNFGPSVYQQSGAPDFSGQRYWGDRQGVRPPEGFVQVQVGSPGNYVVISPSERALGDSRLDAAIPNPNMSLPRAGELMGPGPVYTLGPQVSVPTMVMASYDPALLAAATAQQKQEQTPSPSVELMRRLQLDEGQLRQMREELATTAQQDEQQQGMQAGANNPDNIAMGPETPINDPLNSRLDSSVQAKAIAGSANTDQSMRQNLVSSVPAAERQSSQYAELQHRLERFRQRKNMTDEEANAQFMEDWRAQQTAKQKDDAKRQELANKQAELLREQNNPTGKGPEKTPEQLKQDTEKQAAISSSERARLSIKQQQENAAGTLLVPPRADVPLRIASFADGVKASGLKKLLTDAEKSMQAGKFTQALDYYDAATSVAPNNPMILMGRAIAELGAGYYARAQIHIEQALSTDPALLMARYDLKNFYGEDRLQYIVRDLKDLAQAEQQQARPLFLLAFIAYSTDNEQRTLDYLNMAEKRGGSAAFYQSVKEHWRLVKPQPKNQGK